MRISKKGIELIKKFEGLRLKAYQDAVGVWTIGYGHTGVHATQNTKIDEEKAESILLLDVAHAERVVNENIKSPITQSMFDAMVSFVFNVGAGNFKTSYIDDYTNSGDYHLVREQLMRWVYAGQKKLKGLERRRKAEADLYESETFPGKDTGGIPEAAMIESECKTVWHELQSMKEMIESIQGQVHEIAEKARAIQ